MMKKIKSQINKLFKTPKTQLMRMTKPELARNYLLLEHNYDAVSKWNKEKAEKLDRLYKELNTVYDNKRKTEKNLNEHNNFLYRLVGYLALTTALGFATAAVAILISVY